MFCDETVRPASSGNGASLLYWLWQVLHAHATKSYESHGSMRQTARWSSNVERRAAAMPRRLHRRPHSRRIEQAEWRHCTSDRGPGYTSPTVLWPTLTGYACKRDDGQTQIHIVERGVTLKSCLGSGQATKGRKKQALARIDTAPREYSASTSQLHTQFLPYIISAVRNGEIVEHVLGVYIGKRHRRRYR